MAFDPHVFLDIHSGMEGMMYPNAFETRKKDKLVEQMKLMTNKILIEIEKKFCPGCLTGEAFSTIKYDSFGSSIDHNYFNNDVPLTAVWEIFGDNSTLR